MKKNYRLILTFLLLASVLFAYAQKKPNDYNPFESIGKKGKIVTGYGDRFVEVFDTDSTQRIGSVIFHIYSKKVVLLLNADSIFNKLADNSSASRWYQVDPLAHKYAEHSPYVFVADNPIRYNDPDGREFVDPNGKKISVTFNKNGTLSFSKNATADVIRIANALNGTDAGRAQLKGALASDIKVKMNISTDSKIVTREDGSTSYTYGGTIQGNFNKDDDYGKYKSADGSYGIKEATVTIYEGTIGEGVKEGSGLKHEGLTMEQAIGAVAGHELVHATNKKEINADIKYEINNGGKQRPGSQREVKPNQVEKKIIDQSKQKPE